MTPSHDPGGNHSTGNGDGPRPGPPIAGPAEAPARVQPSGGQGGGPVGIMLPEANSGPTPFLPSLPLASASPRIPPFPQRNEEVSICEALASFSSKRCHFSTYKTVLWPKTVRPKIGGHVTHGSNWVQGFLHPGLEKSGWPSSGGVLYTEFSKTP